MEERQPDELEEREWKTSCLYNDLAEISCTATALEMYKRFSGQIVSFYHRKSEFFDVLEDISDKDTADKFYEKYKKTQRYIGLSTIVKRERDKEIRSLHDGGNRQALARKFGLSTAMIGRIVKVKSSLKED
jgi:hypothetical protein